MFIYKKALAKPFGSNLVFEPLKDRIFKMFKIQWHYALLTIKRYQGIIIINLFVKCPVYDFKSKGNTV